MTEALFMALLQLGAAVVIVAFMWLIIKAVVTFAGANDKDSSTTIATLTTLFATLTNNLSENTKVLIELKTYMSKANEETSAIFNRIESTIARNYSAHDSKLTEIKAIFEEVRQQMDKTVPIHTEGLDEENNL